MAGKTKADKTGPDYIVIVVGFVVVFAVSVATIYALVGMTGHSLKVRRDQGAGDIRTAVDVIGQGMLNEERVVDEDLGIYKISIERAMQLEAKQPWHQTNAESTVKAAKALLEQQLAAPADSSSQDGAEAADETNAEATTEDEDASANQGGAAGADTE